MLRKYRRESRGSKISSDFPPNRPFRKSDTTHPLGNRKSSNHEKRKVSRVHKGRLQFSIDVEEPDPVGPVAVYDFLMAATTGRIKSVRKFLDDGGDVNAKDSCHRTALHRASLYGQIAIVDLLLARKASVNSVDKLSNTPLHWACRSSKMEVVQALMSHHAKINKKDNLLSAPLHVATRVGFADCVDYLLECGAKINERDSEGDLPIHDAVRLGRPRVVRSLILHGADVKAKNKNGKTAFDMMQAWYNNTKEAMARAEAERIRKGIKVDKTSGDLDRPKSKATEKSVKFRQNPSKDLSEYDRMHQLLDALEAHELLDMKESSGVLGTKVEAD